MLLVKRLFHDDTRDLPTKIYNKGKVAVKFKFGGGRFDKAKGTWEKIAYFETSDKELISIIEKAEGEATKLRNKRLKGIKNIHDKQNKSLPANLKMKRNIPQPFDIKYLKVKAEDIQLIREEEE